MLKKKEFLSTTAGRFDLEPSLESQSNTDMITSVMMTHIAVHESEISQRLLQFEKVLCGGDIV